MDDVVVVGAGPAGSVAATILARAGVRVRVLDRATFPREKLCGDTVNPGTLAALRRLWMADDLESAGLRVDGMRVTSGRGLIVEGRYPAGLHGRALGRHQLDWALLQCALSAGAAFESPVRVTGPIIDVSDGVRRVRGVLASCGGIEQGRTAPVTIAADGRHSTLAFGLGLATHPARPRRWAIGAYFENVAGCTSLGEMHIRSGRYIGIAKVPGDLVNVCLVRPFAPGDAALGQPATALLREVGRDPILRDRLADARMVRPPVLLGPLAVDVRPAPLDGLLLAGDAAGFIDPMTGDGLRFAVRGGELAAAAALQAVEHGWAGVHDRLGAIRRREFDSKWRFNRALRALVASPAVVEVAALAAAMTPWAVRALIDRAGDCALAAP